jgi:hypothetical protein
MNTGEDGDEHLYSLDISNHTEEREEFIMQCKLENRTGSTLSQSPVRYGT